AVAEGVLQWMRSDDRRGGCVARCNGVQRATCEEGESDTDGDHLRADDPADGALVSGKGVRRDGDGSLRLELPERTVDCGFRSLRAQLVLLPHHGKRAGCAVLQREHSIRGFSAHGTGDRAEGLPAARIPSAWTKAPVLAWNLCADRLHDAHPDHF